MRTGIAPPEPTYSTYVLPNGVFDGIVPGNGSGVDGVFSSSDARNFHRGAAISATVTGAYRARKTLSGTVNEAGGSATFSTVYLSRYVYEQSVALASYAGTCRLPQLLGSVSIDTTGALTGRASPECARPSG